MDSRGDSRIGIVLDVQQEMHAVGLMFTSNLIENATDLDLRLDPIDVGLSFALIAETDIQSTAWEWQVETIGDRLPEPLLR